MPISADRFDEIDDGDDRPAPGTNADRILAFLEGNPEKAFTQGEIADATDVTRGSVGPTLVRLREKGRVDHRGTYWRISDHERSIGEGTNQANEVARSHEEDPFDYDGWREHAVDPREDRP